MLAAPQDWNPGREAEASSNAARVSLGAPGPIAKETEDNRKHEVSYFAETRAGVGEPFLKSVPGHAIDLRQIEPSYKVRLPGVYIQCFLNGMENGGATESKKSRASMPKRSREELLASLRAILAVALEIKSQRGTSSS